MKDEMIYLGSRRRCNRNRWLITQPRSRNRVERDHSFNDLAGPERRALLRGPARDRARPAELLLGGVIGLVSGGLLAWWLCRAFAEALA